MAFDLNIVSSKNIAKKAIEAVEQLDKALEKSILNDSSKAAKYAIVQENLKSIDGVLKSLSSVIDDINNTFNIKTLIKISRLNKILISKEGTFTTLDLIIRNMFNIFGYINSYLRSVDKNTNNNIKILSNWIKAIIKLFSTKSIDDLLKVPETIGNVDWSKFRTSLNNFVEAIVDVVTNEKLNSLDNGEKKTNRFKWIIKAVNSLKDLIITATLVSLTAISASLIIVPGMIVINMLLLYIFR